MNYLRLEELCRQKNISTSRLAEMVGVSKGNTSTWKKGGNPSLDVLSKMAEVLDSSVDYILGKESVNLKPSKKYGPGITLEASKVDYFSNGCRADDADIIDLEKYSTLAKYLNCDPKFLINSSNTIYTPLKADVVEADIDTDMVFEIINIMSYLPGDDDDRILQIQISRIVLSNLARKGFDEGKVRGYNKIAAKSLDYLYSGESDYKKQHAFGLRFNDIRSLNVKTGLSYQYMFSGVMKVRDRDING